MLIAIHDEENSLIVNISGFQYVSIFKISLFQYILETLVFFFLENYRGLIRDRHRFFIIGNK